MLQLPTPHDGKLWLPPRAIIKPPRRPHRKRSKLAMPSWYIAGNERFRGSVPVSAGFSPANISGLLAWYKSDTQVFSDQAGTTPATNRGHVRLWKDQSGNGNDISDASTGPFFATNQISGLAALQFRSSSNTFLTNSFFPIGTGSVSSCFAVLLIPTVANAFGRIVGYSSTDIDWLLAGNPATTNILGFDGSSQLSGVSFTNNTYIRVGGIWDGTNFTSYLSNAAGSASASSFSFTNNQAFRVGANTSGGALADADIAEIVLTNTVIGSGDRASLDSYFKTRYGLS